MKLRIKSIMIVLTCLLIISIPYLSQTVNNGLKLAIELVLILYIVAKAHNKEAWRSNISVIVFWFVITLCTFLNFGMSSRILNALVTGCSYFLIFYLFNFFCNKYGVQEVINIVWKYVLIILILVDLSVILSGGNGIGNRDGGENLFLIGNKFAVSYYHMFGLALFLGQTVHMKNPKKRNRMLILFAAYSALICHVADCTTGMVGCGVILIIHLISFKKNHIVEILSKPMVITAVFVVSTFLLVGTDVLLNNNFIYNFFSTFSHTPKILSGRLDMYAIAISEIQKSPWVGFGINCTVVKDRLTWGNAQNGLLKMLLDFGIVGTISFFVVFLNSLKNRKGQHKQIEYGLLGFVYAMIVASMVEINISGLFFMSLALIKMAKSQLKEEKI